MQSVETHTHIWKCSKLRRKDLVRPKQEIATYAAWSRDSNTDFLVLNILSIASHLRLVTGRDHYPAAYWGQDAHPVSRYIYYNHVQRQLYVVVQIRISHVAEFLIYYETYLGSIRNIVWFCLTQIDELSWSCYILFTLYMQFLEYNTKQYYRRTGWSPLARRQSRNIYFIVIIRTIIISATLIRL